MTRGPVSASPEPEADRGQAEQDDEAQQQQQQQEGGDQQVTISEEPASIEMSSSPSSSDQDHSHRASTPPAPIKLATVPEPARAAGQTEDGEGEGEERVQQQQEQQQRMSSPPSSSSPVQEGGDEAGQAGGGTASPFAASPSSEHSNLPSTSDARGGSVAEPEETNPRGGRQEERPERPARGQTRQTSREYKETLDAKTKDEKDGTRMLNQYHLTRVIGQGAYGVVFEGRLRDDASEIFAVKELSKTRLKKSRRSEQLRRPGAARGGLRGRGLGRGPSRGTSEDKDEDKDPLELIRREIAIMKKLDHPNIISLHEVLDDPSRDELYMVVEYCPGGVVIDVKLHERTTPLKEDVARSYFVQILLGIEYLHSSDIVHRDIKPANILLAEDGKTCKIVDFGVSELFAPSEKPADAVSNARGQGTPAFLSPEICSARAPSSRQSTGDQRASAEEGAGSEKRGAKSERETSGYRDDMWAFGVTLYCMVVGHLPFDKSGFMDLYEAICNEEPEYPSHLSQECVDLLQKFLLKDPEKRITIEEARGHPWVTLAGTAPIPSAAKNLRAVVSEITEDELRKAICRVSGVFAVARAVTKFKRRTSTARSISGSANGEGGQGSNDRQGSMLWSSSSSNPSSPHVQQGPYDSPQTSPSVSRAGTMLSSLTGGESGLGLTSAINNLKALGSGGGQDGKANERVRTSSEGPENGTDDSETEAKDSEQSTPSLVSPMAWARSAGSSSSLRNGATSLTSAISTAAYAGANTLGLGTIAEVSTPVTPDSKSGWPLSRGARAEPAQDKSEEEADSVDVVDSPSAEEGQQRSDSPTKVESPSSKEPEEDPCEIPAQRREDQSERLRTSLQALEARFEALMKRSDPTAATKHLSNRLHQALPLDRLSAGLKGFGLDTISATLANLIKQDGKDGQSKVGDASGGEGDADEDREESGSSEESEQRGPVHRLDSLIKPDHLEEDEEGHNVHTGRKTSRGTASSGVKVDRISEQQEHWARAEARERGEDSSLEKSTERPHLFDGPVVESPVREEVPMDQAVQTLSALVPEALDAQGETEEGDKAGRGSSKGSGGGKGSGDYFTSSLGPKSKAAAKDRDREGQGQGQRQQQQQQPQEQDEGEEHAFSSTATSFSSGAIDAHSGRIEGEVQIGGEGGEKHYIERPAVGEPSAEDKHEPPVRPSEKRGDADDDGGADGDASGSGGSGSNKASPGTSSASPKPTRAKERSATGADADPRPDGATQADRDAPADTSSTDGATATATATPASAHTDAHADADTGARTISTEDSLPASGFGDADGKQEEEGQGREGGPSTSGRDRKKGGQGAALL